MVKENLYCGYDGKVISVLSVTYSPERRSVYCSPSCLLYSELLRMGGRITFKQINREKALRLLNSGGIETRIEAQENRAME